MPPVTAAWRAGGAGVLVALGLAALTVIAVLFVRRRLGTPLYRRLAVACLLIGGGLAARAVFAPAVEAIEAVEPTVTGYLGGLGLPIVLSWLVGGAFAAGAAWVCRISLSLRSDYLAIATLGISEIIVAFLKYEEWLTRGVKNVNGLPRPGPLRDRSAKRGVVPGVGIDARHVARGAVVDRRQAVLRGPVPRRPGRTDVALRDRACARRGAG